jgi:hypothetical protein
MICKPGKPPNNLGGGGFGPSELGYVCMLKKNRAPQSCGMEEEGVFSHANLLRRPLTGGSGPTGEGGDTVW